MVKDYLGFIPIFGKLLGPLWNKAMGGSGYVYPMSAAEGELLNWGQTAVELIDGTQKLIEGELDSSGENAGWKKLEKGFEGTFEAIAHMRGIPYGWQDIPRIVKRLFPNDPDFEALMRDEGKSVPITQENLRILRAIAEDNDEEFRKYVERLSAKRERPTESDVVAIVNREFGKFTKYEPGEDARKAKEAELAAIPLTPRKRFQGLRWRLGLDGLSQDREQRSEFLEYVDLKLAERAELREAAEDMVMRNRDIIRSTPRKR